MENKQRLIDANLMREDWLENGENEYVYDTNAVLASIDEQPTVDAVEVVHSRWEITDIEHAYGTRCYHCPECGEDEWRHDEPNYCPNCGAKMDGGN